MKKNDWKKFQAEAISIALVFTKTQNELARRLGISRQELSRWKCGKVQMSIERLLELEQIVDEENKNAK
jgi:DNA-binding transcriptional regulator YdaS (Cro superfamily)